MTISSKRFWILAAVLVAINLAGIAWIYHDMTARGPGKFQILSFLPQGPADAADRFVLVFDEPMVATAALNLPVDKAPFVVQPPAAGHWQWAARDRLEFLLDEALPPGRTFRVLPAAEVEMLLGGRLIGTTDFVVATRPLRLRTWSIVHVDPLTVDLQLEFNQPVSPRDLIRHVRFFDSKTDLKLDMQCLTNAPAATLRVRCTRPESKLRISIDGDLVGHGGELSLIPDDPIAFPELTVDPRFALTKVYVRDPALATDIRVAVYFSTAMDTEQDPPAVELIPEVPDMHVARESDRCLLVTGPFKCNTRYILKVPASLRSADGQTLGKDRTVHFDVPARDPAIEFTAADGVLSPAGNMMLDAKIVNVGEVKLEADRVHANNLVSHLARVSRRLTSRPIAEKTVSLNLVPDKPSKVALDLRALLGEGPGIYHVRVKATDRRWTSDSAVVAVTNLGITAKQTRDGYLVWVTSLSAAKPVAGATVSAVTRNNQVVASARTGADGLARLSAPAKTPDGPVWVITAQAGEDLCYLRPAQRPWSIEGVKQSGRDHPGTYDVMVYTERGVYRPGETIHLTGIVRDTRGHIPPPLPLALTVERPDGRTVTQAIHFDPTRQGIFHADFTPAQDAQTGFYTMSISLPGSEEALGRTSAMVEAFVPARLEVKARATQPVVKAGEPIEITAEARYLFGQPAAGLPVKVTGSLRLRPYKSKRLPDFAFGDPRRSETSFLPDTGTVLDERGRATLPVQPIVGELTGTLKGWWAGTASVTVSEAGGRSVSANVPVAIDTAGRYVGLRPPRGNLLATNAPVNVDWAIVNADDSAADGGKLTVTLSRIRYDWSIKTVNGRYVWETSERLVEVKRSTIEAGGPTGTLDFQCPDPGTYRLQVTDVASGSVTGIELTAAWDNQDVAGFGVSRPGKVELTLDKKRYAPGRQATLLVRSPFVGTMLLTMETDTVIEQRVVVLEGKSAQLKLAVPASLRGGAFVAATVIRAVDPQRDKWLPVRAIGLARLETTPAGHALPVSIEAAATARPGQKVRVTIKTPAPVDPEKPGMVHLWAVDEGICLTTAFDTPDPLKHFFGHRKLAVVSSDMFMDLLPDYRRPESMRRIGADGGIARRRTAPVPVRVRKSAIIWRKAVPLGPDGSATADISMPEINTEMRLMAVAVDGDRYGSARRPLTVASPMMVETSWPRFASPGDTFNVPVKVFNTTAGAVNASISLQIVGPLTVTDASLAKLAGIEIPAGASRTVWLDATATGIGQITAVATARATAGGEELVARDRAVLTVRPASTLETITKLMAVSVDKADKIPINRSAFLPGTARTTVSISGRPTVQLRGAIEKLIGYPYGCVEQTTSRLYPMLQAPALLGPDDARTAGSRKMVRAGILRLWSMQTPDGGLSYWPGGSRSDLWGTAYAAGFLARARAESVPVEPQLIEGLVRFLRTELRSGHGAAAKDQNLQATICYVLATFHKPELAWMNRLHQRPDKLDIGGRAHLAAAWLAVGRRDRALTALPEETINQTVAATTGGRITSQVTQEAALLEVLVDIQPDHPWTVLLAARLDKARSDKGYWHSTVENAACVAALARYQAAQKTDTAFAGTARCGKTARQFDSRKVSSFTVTDKAPGNDAIELLASGSGTIYVAVTTEGMLKAPAAKAYDRQMTVRREWSDRKGNPIDPAKVRVGDLVQVKVTCELTGERRRSIENVAVVDALPGGFEVENPRLATSAQDEGNPPAEHVEFRDDRVLIFATIGTEPKTFRYSLRVITAGQFVLPAVQAACMYDASYASVHGAGKVVVSK